MGKKKKKREGKETKYKNIQITSKRFSFSTLVPSLPTRRSQSSATRGLRYPAREVVSVDVL